MDDAWSHMSTNPARLSLHYVQDVDISALPSPDFISQEDTILLLATYRPSFSPFSIIPERTN